MSLRRVGERAPKLEVALSMAEAFVARAQSRHEDSIEKGLEALTLNIETFGEDDPITGDLLNNVGALYHDAMRGSEGAEYLERSLENRRKVLGPEHPKLGLAYNNLAVQYMNTDAERAFRYADKALQIRLAAYGPDHPVVADSYFTIGTVNQVNGHPEEAAEAYEKVLEIRRAVHGSEHLALAKPINNIGTLAFVRGDYETAIDYYGQALRLYEAVYGETHIEIARSLKNRGHAHLRARRYAEAAADLERGLEVSAAIWGEDERDLGLLCAILGDAYAGMNELEKAQAVLARGLELRKGGEAPWELAILRTVMGEVLWRRGTDRKRAVELVEQAEAWFAEKPEQHERGLSRTRDWLAGKREWREDRPTL